MGTPAEEYFPYEFQETPPTVNIQITFSGKCLGCKRDFTLGNICSFGYCMECHKNGGCFWQLVMNPLQMLFVLDVENHIIGHGFLVLNIVKIVEKNIIHVLSGGRGDKGNTLLLQGREWGFESPRFH